MHTEPRGAIPITLVVIHTNEGSEGNRSAQALAEYLKTIPGGYHKVGDNAECVTCATDNLIVWGAGGVNSRAVHYCCIGYANQSVEQWHDTFSTSELKIAAAHVAIWCIKYRIPVRRLSPAQVKTGALGICGHVDVTDPASQGHTDPGPNFPWTEFLTLVAKAVTPPNRTKPMYDPPVVPVGGIAADCAAPEGGAWSVTPDGHVYTFGGAPYLGAPRGKPYWGDRKAAQIRAKNYGNSIRRKWGYAIEATTGEVYDFKPT